MSVRLSSVTKGPPESPWHTLLARSRLAALQFNIEKCASRETRQRYVSNLAHLPEQSWTSIDIVKSFVIAFT